jgi:hypothetical protein
MFDHHLDAAFLPERRGVREDLAPVDPALFFLDAQIERVLLAQRMCIGNDSPGGGDRICERCSLLSCRKVRDVRFQSARGELLFEGRNRFGGRDRPA